MNDADVLTKQAATTSTARVNGLPMGLKQKLDDSNFSWLEIERTNSLSQPSKGRVRKRV